jgi:hypothetical protein
MLPFLGRWLYWLLRTSIREIDNQVCHNPPLFLCHVVLSHRCGRAMFLRHVTKRENHAFLCSIHSGKPCQGYMRGLPMHLHTRRCYPDAPRPSAVLSNTLYQFRLPIGSHGGVHPRSEQQLLCPLHDERNESNCSVQEAVAVSLDAVVLG